MQKKVPEIKFDQYLKKLFGIKALSNSRPLVKGPVIGKTNHFKETLAIIPMDKVDIAAEKTKNWQNRTLQKVNYKQEVILKPQSKSTTIIKRKNTSLAKRAKAELARREKINLILKDTVALTVVSLLVIAFLSSFFTAIFFPQRAKRLSDAFLLFYSYPLRATNYYLSPNSSAYPYLSYKPETISQEIKSAYIRNNIAVLQEKSRNTNIINIYPGDLKGTVAGISEEYQNKDISILSFWQQKFSFRIYGYYNKLAQKQRNLAVKLNNKLTEFLYK